VATGILTPEHIAAPLRHVLCKQANTTVLKETVIGVDAEKKLCVVQGAMVTKAMAASPNLAKPYARMPIERTSSLSSAS
jgi:NADH dehydrogenase FAD-containing subunit